MIPATFEYARARSLNAALKALAAGDGTKVIAGGQTLIPLLRFRLAQPGRLMDIGHLAKLQGVQKARGGVRIGAATTYRELLDSELLQERYPLIGEVTEGIGDRQVRNLGTIGGSLAHADPASDMPAAMLALDATFTVQSARGKRTVRARDFFKGPFATAMTEDELLVDIHLPTLPKHTGAAYVSFAQRASGYALVGAAVVVALSRRTVKHAALAFTGLAGTPFIADAARLVDSKAEPDIVAEVAQAAASGVEANDDIHAPAEYRIHLASVAARRALTAAVERAG